MLSDRQRSLTEISPLTQKEVNAVCEKRLNAEEKIFTPKGKGGGGGVKRKTCASMDKENCPPKKQLKRKVVELLSPGSKPPPAASSRFPASSTAVAPRRTLQPAASLTKQQQAVLQTVLTGENVFFTGSAGTGKSFLLRRIIGSLPPAHTVATASTGVAACHIGGVTLHAFAGIGSGSATLERCVELASRPIIAQQWRKCKHLIIDEISMVDSEFFDKLDTVARVVRKSEDPFGGIQLILCGDFLQLPPVYKGANRPKKRFAFQSKSWRRAICTCLQLNEVRRQTDHRFIDILNQIRLGRCDEKALATLVQTQSHSTVRNGIRATRLSTHKEDVDHLNNIQLQKLAGTSRNFAALDSDVTSGSIIDSLSPVVKNLELKVGAQVMLAKNLDVSRGLVNGARGVVTGFEPGNEGFPLVTFLSGVVTSIRPERWVFKGPGGSLMHRRQVPLKLAWAISIHKSQGMSLDSVEVSLSRVFEAGQAYVALSRATSLQGLRVLDIDKSNIRADQEVIAFYRQLNMLQKNRNCGGN